MNILLRPLAVGLGLVAWNHRDEVKKAVSNGLRHLNLSMELGLMLKVNSVEIRQLFKANAGNSSPR